uniref:multiple inositol polyphosphate phosphatase 1-like n=1 Tax=Ciona intestinalis TaxID=7719 RepID=UPI000180C273|nr:multiple inositol polyphosphate phosphatase 1-like [Ciona intestinalis]|eukprot:XP_002131712.1 multiple inositol polyphosphate phosphatase 1-like [Ciona intestinalis]
MRDFLAVSLFLLICTFRTFICQDAQPVSLCSDDPKYGSNFYPYFGSRTLYKHVRGELPKTRAHMRGCRPLYVYIVARHGSRYPHKGIHAKNQRLFQLARQINTLGTATLCSKDIQALRNWRVWTNSSINRNQTDYGDEEIRGIARRFKRMLPELFPENAKPNKYSFLSSDFPRTIDSMQVFAEEILGQRTNEANLEVEGKNVTSSIIRSYKNCLKYQTQVFDNDERFLQFNRFFLRNRGFGGRARNLIATRLGVPVSIVTKKLVFIFYEICYLQQRVETVNGPWCSLFSRLDLKRFEYASDLKETGLRTSLNEVTYKQSCPLAKDIIGNLNDAVEADRTGGDHPMGAFRFGHVTTILSVGENLGLFQTGNPLRNGDYFVGQKTRFRSARTIPSAGNLAFVLYKCENARANNDRYSVEVYHNEKLVVPPSCSRFVEWDGNYFCPMQDFLRRYEEFIPGSRQECNFEKICRVRN